MGLSVSDILAACLSIIRLTVPVPRVAASTFSVAPNTIEQLTFGTCRFWFQNNSNSTLTECWTALVRKIEVYAYFQR